MQVYIVDDDADIHATLVLGLRSCTANIRSFLNPETFVDALDYLAPGIVLLDLQMPTLDGLQVQQAIAERGAPLAVIFLTGVGDVPQAVRAVRDGAVDFLRKPFRRATLIEAIERAEVALDHLIQAHERRRRLSVLEKLTPRERDVLDALACGQQSKMIAFRLGISTRTVEMHRGNITAKLCTSIAGALMMAQEAGMVRAA